MLGRVPIGTPVGSFLPITVLANKTEHLLRLRDVEMQDSLRKKMS
jgi:hypothetical protein